MADVSLHRQVKLTFLASPDAFLPRLEPLSFSSASSSASSALILRGRPRAFFVADPMFGLMSSASETEVKTEDGVARMSAMADDMPESFEGEGVLMGVVLSSRLTETMVNTVSL